MKYLSARDRLSRMPPFFHINDFLRVQGVSSPVARNMLSRLVDREMVVPLGGKSGIYFNVDRHPDAIDRWHRQAILRAYPSAIEIGPGPLRDEGWITQIPRQIEVAALHAAGRPRLHGARVYRRPRVWYRTMEEYWSRDGHNHDIPRLTPAAALADMWVYQDGWVPDEEDLYLDESDETEVEQIMERLSRAIRLKKAA